MKLSAIRLFTTAATLLVCACTLYNCNSQQEPTDAPAPVVQSAPAAPAAPAKPAPQKDGHDHNHGHPGPDVYPSPEHHPHDECPFKKNANLIEHLENSERRSWQKPNAVVVTLDLEGNETVVDLGAGSGFFTFPFAKALPLGKVLALDTEPDMVNHIRKRAKAQGASNVEARLISTDAPTIDPETRLLFMCNVLHHVQNRSKWLKGVFDQLPKGARFALIEFKMGELPVVAPPETMRIPRKELLDLARKTGFVLDAEHEKLLPHQLFFVFRKP